MDLDEEIGHLRMHRDPDDNQDCDDLDIPDLLNPEDDSEDEYDEDEDDGEVEERYRKAQKVCFHFDYISIADLFCIAKYSLACWQHTLKGSNQHLGIGT
jgi:hypothetical protein